MSTPTAVTTVQELAATVEKALRLLTSEQADAIIGQRSPEYDTLIQGAQALQGLTWALAKGNGMKETVAVQLAGAQGLAAFLTLVHYAYALGLHHGRADREAEDAAEQAFQDESG